VCVCASVSVRLYVYASTCLCVCVSTFVLVFLSAYLCEHLRVHLCAGVRVHVLICKESNLICINNICIMYKYKHMYTILTQSANKSFPGGIFDKYNKTNVFEHIQIQHL